MDDLRRASGTRKALAGWGGHAPADPSRTRGEIASAIEYSVAPWCGPAYEMRVPLRKSRDAANPVIRINLRGNPELAKPQTVRLAANEGPKTPGNAFFQPVLNHSFRRGSSAGAGGGVAGMKRRISPVSPPAGAMFLERS